jgi:hypothetical protein
LSQGPQSALSGSAVFEGKARTSCVTRRLSAGRRCVVVHVESSTQRLVMVKAVDPGYPWRGVGFQLAEDRMLGLPLTWLADALQPIGTYPCRSWHVGDVREGPSVQEGGPASSRSRAPWPVINAPDAATRATVEFYWCGDDLSSGQSWVSANRSAAESHRQPRDGRGSVGNPSPVLPGKSPNAPSGGMVGRQPDTANRGVGTGHLYRCTRNEAPGVTDVSPVPQPPSRSTRRSATSAARRPGGARLRRIPSAPDRSRYMGTLTFVAPNDCKQPGCDAPFRCTCTEDGRGHVAG